MNPQSELPPEQQPVQRRPSPWGVEPHPTKPPAIINPEVLARHDESKRLYPELSLSAGEYVIEEVRRHPIGLLSIWFIVVFLVLIALAIAPFYAANQPLVAQVFMTTVDKLPSPALLFIPSLLLTLLFVLGGIVATIIYNGNKFFITNESIVQFIQIGLFNTKQQVVNLINVEDASSEQVNILEQLLNYGTIKLSTQGEQTVYHFRFVANPKRVVHLINDAAERAVKILQGYPASEY